MRLRPAGHDQRCVGGVQVVTWALRQGRPLSGMLALLQRLRCPRCHVAGNAYDVENEDVETRPAMWTLIASAIMAALYEWSV